MSHSQKQSHDTFFIIGSADIVALKQQIAQNECRMIRHDHIVAAQHHQNHDEDTVCKKRISRWQHIGEARTCDQHAEDQSDTDESVRRADSEICLTQHQKSQKTTTPAMLLAEPNSRLKAVTTAKQNATTRYTFAL